MLRLAIVGLGHRAMNMLKTLREVNPEIQLAGMVDPNPKAVRERLTERKIEANNVLVMDSVDSIIKKRDQFDGVMIGTRCHLHTPLAVKLAEADLPLFLEKPVAINTQQLEALAAAYAGKEDRVVVSFPLRVTPLFTEALAIVRSGRLGTLSQIQAFNDVPYGGCYFHEWYRSFEQTGGLWLQKATHDVDYINLLAGSRPATVAAMISRQTYDDPATATFLDSTPTKLKETLANEPARHQDAGSAIFMYQNGLHASYSQNFVTRRHGKRGATIVGHLATLHFDWHTHTITVHDHYKSRTDRIEVKASEDQGHLGGDHTLARNFSDLMQGKDKSQSTLHDGLLSAAMCLAARESANTHTFQPIIVPGQTTPPQGPHAREDLNQYQRTLA